MEFPNLLTTMYLHLSLSLSLILILVAGLSLAARQPYVETEDGALLGTTASSWGGREYYQFLGIPYAEPPVCWYKTLISCEDSKNNFS